MPRKSLDELKAYLSVLLDEETKARDRQPADLRVFDVGPGWPRVGPDLVADQVGAEQSSPEKTKKLLVARLEKFLYPYPEGNKKGKTFYDHLRSLNLLDVLLNPPLLWDIRLRWFSQAYDVRKRQLNQKRLSQHGYPLKFHRQMLTCLFGHIEQITRLAEKHDVPDQEWFADYYPAIQKHFLREAKCYYPELGYLSNPELHHWLKPANQLRVHSYSVSEQVEIYQSIDRAFEKRKMKNNKLAYQLTALICSSPDRAQMGELDPDPEQVRKYVRDWKKRHTRRLTKGRTKPRRNPNKKT